jgi:NAD(P)-dependent dehydrogenase (short-subunit alcohol dehydrogenase family)
MASSRKVVLVTGGSRGIGAAVCRMAARRGYAVAVNYQRDAEAAERVAADCRAAGAACEIVQGDMAVEAEVERVFAACDERLGRLTHLVNNAGIIGQASRLDAATPATIRAAIDLNVTGAILVARAAVRRMARSLGGPGGAIVNISSMAATLGGGGQYVWYAASKGAIDAFTIGLARELATDGVRVNAISPGLIETDIHASAGIGERMGQAASLVPMGRSGTPEEVAQAVLYLLSDEASYVTGANLKVSGGR